MLKVTNEVSTYDKPEKPFIRVCSHWNDSNMAVIEIGDKKVTVLISDMEKALANARNKSR